MAHHKSCIKRIKTSAKANERNRSYRSKMKTAVRRVRESESQEQALERFKIASSLMDKMALKNVIHNKNANNQKSRLNRWINRQFIA